MSSSFIIGSPEEQDKEIWLQLFKDYYDFYEIAAPSPESLDKTWNILLDSNKDPHGIFARDKTTNKLIGFLHYILHNTTDAPQQRCYLQDAYTHPEIRRKGVFSELYKTLKLEGQKQNWQKIYWITEPNNTIAQSLYNQFAKPKNWIRYEDNMEAK